MFITLRRRAGDPYCAPSSPVGTPWPVALERTVDSIGEGARAGGDAHAVVDHQIIVGVLVGLVELLRGGDDIDFLRVAEALHDGGCVFGRGIVVEGDQGRARLGRSRARSRPRRWKELTPE